MKIYKSTPIFIIMHFCMQAIAQQPTSEMIKTTTSDILKPSNPEMFSAAAAPSKAGNSEKTVLSFFGSGDIQKSLNQGSKPEANTGLGVLFFRQFDGNSHMKIGFQSIEFDFTVNVASTADTIVAKSTNSIIANKRDFGSYILNPTNSKQATYFNFMSYFNPNMPDNILQLKDLFQVVDGIQVRFIGSNSVWSVNDTTNINLAGFLFRVGVFHDFIPDNIRKEKDYSITIGANYSYRGILGDIRFDNYKLYREQLLGTGKKRFHGFEANASIRLKNFRAEIQIPVFNGKRDQVAGLTNTQFVTSIRFVGGFPIEVGSKGKNNTSSE